MRRLRIYSLCVMILVFAGLSSAQIPKPEEVLGFVPGTDRKMADMFQILDYFRKLDRASGRVKVEEIGKTTEGNPFVVAVITSEKNHRNLERYRTIQQRLADPRTLKAGEAEGLIEEGKAVVMINCSLHASEIGASQMSMQLAHDLAAGKDENTRFILDNVVLLLLPMHNPDGTQMVADWYKKNLGTRYEGGRMPWLYQKYVGHDNNRDWYMFTQAESRLTIEVHNAWHPQVVLDMHQMGNRGARIFVPPYIDPYEPNIDPIIQQQVAAMGTFVASEMTAQGLAGVMHSTLYDAWTPARAYHHYHGGIRILTEVASARIATPVEIPFEDLSPAVRIPSVKMAMPWKGGKWGLPDIVAYDYAAARAVLRNAASLRESWVRSFYRIHEKAVAPKTNPFAFVIPAGQRDDPSALRLLQTLQMGGVEVHRTAASFKAGGRTFPAGSHIIYRSQPYGGYAKALLEKQVYPELREYPGAPLKTPYDVVAHTLPLLMGVEVTAVDRPFETEAVLQGPLSLPAGRVEEGAGYGYAWGHETNDDIRALNRLLAAGYRAAWAREKFQQGGRLYPMGTMLVQSREGLTKELHRIAGDLPVRFQVLETEPSVSVIELNPVRLGLYKGWTASMDEGWTRWVLEQHEFPFRSLMDEDIRKGELNRELDVIILPDLSERAILQGNPQGSVPEEYAGGIGPAGLENLRDFVVKGGTLIAVNGAADFCSRNFYLAVFDKVEGLSRGDFFIPGSIMKAVVDNSHPIAYGFPRDGAVFFRRSPVFEVGEGKAVIRYPAHSLLSGWASGEDRMTGGVAVADIPYERGRIILIGFPVVYRAQAHGTFRFLFNSIFYGGSGRRGP
jgi:hypothetical protein